MSTPAIFLLSAACGLIGALVTWLFVPDVTTLDMKELDKRWASLQAGGPAYSGPAVDPKYLSVWERLAGVITTPIDLSARQLIQHVEQQSIEMELLTPGPESTTLRPNPLAAV